MRRQLGCVMIAVALTASPLGMQSRAGVIGIQRDQVVSVVADGFEEKDDIDGDSDLGFGQLTTNIMKKSDVGSDPVVGEVNSNASLTASFELSSSGEIVSFAGFGDARVEGSADRGKGNAQGNFAFTFSVVGAPTPFNFSLGGTSTVNTLSGNNETEFILSGPGLFLRENAPSGFSQMLQPGGPYELSVNSFVSASPVIVGNDSWSNREQWSFSGQFKPRQKVVLAFGHDAPEGRELIDTSFGSECLVVDESSPAFLHFVEEVPGVFSDFQLAVQTYVQTQLANSGVQNVDIVIGDPEPHATNAYFIESDCPNVFGDAPLDRFNSDPSNVIVIQINDEMFDGEIDFDPEFTAETVTHEIGHSLGLAHVDPPGSVAVMDYGDTKGEVEVFQNGPFNITEPPVSSGVVFDVKQNPLYHLLRYVDGHSHEGLIGLGIHPGTWDLPEFTTAELFIDLDFDPVAQPLDATEGGPIKAPSSGGSSISDLVLYDVLVLDSEGSRKSSVVLHEFDQITLAEFSDLEISINELDGLTILAASEPGGELNIASAVDDPNDPNARTLYPGAGQTDAFLQMADDSPRGYQTLATVEVSVSVVPEPSSAMMLLTLVGVLIARYRRTD